MIFAWINLVVASAFELAQQRVLPPTARALELVKRGHTAMAREDYVTALDEFVGALEIDPTNAEAHFQLGYLFSLYGKNEEAIRYYAASLRFSDDPKMIAEAGRRVEALRRATEQKSENE